MLPRATVLALRPPDRDRQDATSSDEARYSVAAVLPYNQPSKSIAISKFHGLYTLSLTPAILNMILFALHASVSWYQSSRYITSRIPDWMMTLEHSLQGNSAT
mmetsp:Transcript_12214/g.26441  ORF Transcript_12214/g.26441 Transcript_12214/m.26441 type:complete len:103 (-) Transcript_12214:163-471(-)